MDHYLFYDLTLATICGMTNVLAFLCVFLGLNAGYCVDVHIIVFLQTSSFAAV